MFCEVVEGSSNYGITRKITEIELDGYVRYPELSQPDTAHMVGMNGGVAICFPVGLTHPSYVGTNGLATCTAVAITFQPSMVASGQGGWGRQRNRPREGHTSLNQCGGAVGIIMHISPPYKASVLKGADTFLLRTLAKLSSAGVFLETHVVAPIVVPGNSLSTGK